MLMEECRYGESIFGFWVMHALVVNWISVRLLDKRLQGQKIIPKWNARPQLQIYLGHSHCHAASVALVLNTKTFHVSPQYYIAFDDDFLTIPKLAAEDIPLKHLN